MAALIGCVWCVRCVFCFLCVVVLVCCVFCCWSLFLCFFDYLLLLTPGWLFSIILFVNSLVFMNLASLLDYPFAHFPLFHTVIFLIRLVYSLLFVVSVVPLVFHWLVVVGLGVLLCC